jgi:hypothetical protein
MILKSEKMLKTHKIKQTTTLHNRLKKHAKQNCHYNYFSIYNMSLMYLFLSGIPLLKQENEYYSKYLYVAQILKIKHRIAHGNLHEKCSTILNFRLLTPFNVVLGFAFKLV